MECRDLDCGGREMGEVVEKGEAESTPSVVKLILNSQMLEDMNIGVRYWDSSLKDLNESLQEKLKRYVEAVDKQADDGIGLLFSGGFELGMKAASALLKALRRRYHSVYCVNINELKDWVWERRQTDDGNGFVEFCIEKDFLCIWGLGDEWKNDKQYIDSMLARIVQTAYRDWETDSKR